MTMVEATELTWAAPGPGRWEWQGSHVPGVPTPIYAELHPRTAEAGLRTAFERYGVPLATFAERMVNGYVYAALQPLVGEPGGKPPPAPLLWLATRLHPEFRRRNRTATAALRTKQWRARTAWWHAEGRPAEEAANLALQREDVAGLDDAELLAHLDRAVARCDAGLRLHFDLHADDMGPLGLYFMGCRRWGIEPAEAMGALAGHSPSTTEGVLALRVVADAVGPDLDAVRSLADVRASSPAAAAALDAYLERWGWRLLTGYDLDARTIGELPEALVANLRACRHDRVGLDGDAVVGSLRGRVPAAEVAEFDELLDDARSALDLRDANGPITVEWPTGLVRRALLAIGRRLVDRGALVDAEHAVELTVAELRTLVSGGEGAGPSAADVADRAAARRAAATVTPPAGLGPAEAPPPLHLFPKALATVAEMSMTAVSLLERSEPVAVAPMNALAGLGVGTESFTGPARVVRCADDALDAVEPGDVLVVPFTTPAYNAVLAVVGGVVTEEGGVLSHTAVLARELGFPAVVGASGALSRIPDGATVTVDPTAGTVTIAP